MYLAVLDEFVISNHLFEGRDIHEVVMRTIYFSGAWTSRRVGYAEPKTVWIALLNQALDDCAFADSGRTQNHQRAVLLALVELG